MKKYRILKGLFFAMVAAALMCSVVTAGAKPYSEDLKEYFLKADFEDDYNPFSSDETLSMSNNEDGKCISLLGNDRSINPEILLDTQGSFTLEFSMKASTNTYPYVYLRFDNGDYVQFFNVFDPSIRSSQSYFAGDYSCVPYYPPYGEYDETTQDKYYSFRTEWTDWKFEFDEISHLVTVYINGVKAERYFDTSYINQRQPKWSGKSLKGIKFRVGNSGTKAEIDNIKVYKTAKAEDDIKSINPEYDATYKMLEYLGITADGMNSLSYDSKLKRQDFLVSAINLMNGRVSVSGEADCRFTDVIINNKAYNYIVAADKRGYIKDSENNKFRPTKPITHIEAVSIITNILGYGDVAEYKGGYPDAYLNTAIYEDLVEGINVESINQYMTMYDAAIMLENALTIPLINVYLEDGKVGLDNNGEDTLLSRYFDLTKKQCVITYTDTNTRQITAWCEEDNASYSYNLDKAVSQLNIMGTSKYVFIDDNDTVVFMKPYENSTSYYGYVSGYNKNKKLGTVSPSDLDKVQFSNFATEFLVSSDFELYKDGSLVERNTDVPLVNSLVRFIYEDGKIVRMYMLGNSTNQYTSDTGGIISSASSDTIRYYTYGSQVKFFKDYENYHSITTVIDGVEASYTDLTKDMVFDYITDNARLYILASKKSYNGTVKSYSNNTLTVDDYILSYTDKPVYVSQNGGMEYMHNYNLGDLMRVEITAYLDMSGGVRFINTQISSGELYAIIHSVGEEEDTINVWVIENGKLLKRTYVCDLKKNIYYPDVSYEVAVSNAKNANGDGIYKVKILNNKIVKITTPKWSDNYLGKGGVSNKYKRMSVVNQSTKKSGYINVDTDTILMLSDYDSNFNPRLMSLNDLISESGRNFNSVGMKYIINEKEDFVKPELLLLTSQTDQIYYGLVNYGLVTEIYEEYSELDEEVYYTYSIVMNNDNELGTSTVLSTREIQTPEGKKLQQGDFIIFYENSLFEETGNIYVSNAVNLESIITNSESKMIGDYSLCYAGTVTASREGYMKIISDGGEQEWVQCRLECQFLKTEDGVEFEAADANSAIGKKIFTIKSSNEKSYPNGLLTFVVIYDED